MIEFHRFSHACYRCAFPLMYSRVIPFKRRQKLEVLSSSQMTDIPAIAG
jgi:hypothetical protein